MKQRFTHLFRSMRYALFVVALMGVCQQTKAESYPDLTLHFDTYDFIHSWRYWFGYEGVDIYYAPDIVESGVHYRYCKHDSKNERFYGCAIATGVDEGVTHVIVKDEITYGGKAYKVAVIKPDFISGNKEVTTLTIGANVDIIGCRAFAYCPKLTTVFNRSKPSVVGQYAFRDSRITNTVDGLPLNVGLYDKCDYIKSVDLSQYWGQTIPTAAFTGTQISTLTIPSTITSIDEGAFTSSRITEVKIEGNATKAMNYASNFGSATRLFINGATVEEDFAKGAKNLAYVNLGNTVTINRNAFANCTKLTTINVEKAANIMDCAFYGCTGLESLTLKNSKCTPSSFDGCANLKTVTLNTMGYSGWSFKGNEAITTLYLENCPQVPKEAFRGCYNLAKITSTGTSATTIGDYAFADCTSLNDVYFHELYAINEGGFRGCSALKDFGSSKMTGLKTVDYRAFENCTSLEGYINLSSCTQLGEYIFNNAGTEDLHITIGLNPCGYNKTFSGCRAGYLTCNDTRIFNRYSATNNDSPLNGSHFQVVEFPEMTYALPAYIFHNMPELQVVKMPKLTDATNLNKNFGFCPALSSLDIVNSKLRYYGGGVYSNDFKTLYYILPSYTSFQAHLFVTKVYADCADQPSWTGGSMSRLGMLDLSLCGPVELYNPKGTYNSPCHYVRIPYGKRKDYKTFADAGMEFITDYIKGDVNEDASVTNADAQGVYIEMDNAE